MFSKNKKLFMVGFLAGFMTFAGFITATLSAQVIYKEGKEALMGNLTFSSYDAKIEINNKIRQFLLTDIEYFAEGYSDRNTLTFSQPVVAKAYIGGFTNQQGKIVPQPVAFSGKRTEVFPNEVEFDKRFAEVLSIDKEIPQYDDLVYELQSAPDWFGATYSLTTRCAKSVNIFHCIELDVRLSYQGSEIYQGRLKSKRSNDYWTPLPSF